MKSEICVSDADILIELCSVGRLCLLQYLFAKVAIPGRVHNEVMRLIQGTKGEVAFRKLEEDGLLVAMNLRDRETFTMQQIRSMDILMESYRQRLDPGELEAAALLCELELEVLLSNDRAAKSIITDSSDINCQCLGVEEVLTLAEVRGVLSPCEAERIFHSLNNLRNYPKRAPWSELKFRAYERILGCGLQETAASRPES